MTAANPRRRADLAVLAQQAPKRQPAAQPPADPSPAELGPAELGPAELGPAELRAWGKRSTDIPKTRDCLRCGTSFLSQWSGQRVCPHCKGSAVWRDGASAPSRLASNRR